MLTRILSAIVLIPIVIASVIYLPENYFLMAVIVVFALGAYEMLRFRLSKTMSLIQLGLFVLLTLVAHKYFDVQNFMYVALGFWSFAFAALSFYPKLNGLFDDKRTFYLVHCAMFMPPILCAVALRAKFGHMAFLQILYITFAADSGAYFAGKFCGKNKLCSSISPKKTIEGLVGGFLTAVIVNELVLYFVGGNEEISYLFVLPIVLVSVIGDLTESIVKRVYHVKDSGTLIPGHGGVFDRVDSLLAVLPISYFLLTV